MNKVSKKNSEVHYCKSERKYTNPSKNFKEARKAYHKAVRQESKKLCDYDFGE